MNIRYAFCSSARSNLSRLRYLCLVRLGLVTLSLSLGLNSRQPMGPVHPFVASRG